MKNTKMHGWKVVDRTTRCSFAPFYALDHNGKIVSWSVVYPPNEEVFPKIKGSKLFFFKLREDADNFASRSDVLIVPCIATNPQHIKKACMTWGKQFRPLSFWKNIEWKNKEWNDYYFGTPQGSWIADSITCLE